MMAAPDSLHLHLDLMSQPCRAVAILCRLNRLPVVEVPVSIGRGEQRRPEFRSKVNPLGKLPALTADDGFRLAESASIMRFLADQSAGLVADQWYPSCPRQRATVNSICDWHLGNTRPGSMHVVFNRAVSLSMGFEGNEQLVQIYGLPLLQQSLKTLERVWLAEGPFLGGRAAPSIADLLVATELEQLTLLDAAAQPPSFDELLAPYPRIRAWMEQVASACQPAWDETHMFLRKVRKRLLTRKQKKEGGESKL